MLQTRNLRFLKVVVNVDITKRARHKILFWTIAIIIPIMVISFVVISALGAVDAAEKEVVSLLVYDNTSDTSGRTPILDFEVLRWHRIVEYWANHYGISDWTMELLAIMYVETKGKHPDLMQSSESAGLPPNTLKYEDSIEQGVRYLAQIITQARSVNIEDNHAIFQAYNFGIFYINYLANNNLSHRLDVAATYSRAVVAPSLGNTSGRRLAYPNPIAIANGKPWLYVNGGNFHYAFIVQYTLDRMNIADGGDASFSDGIQFPLDPPFHITSSFGSRWGTHHYGIDLSVRFGASIRSVLAGEVIRVVNHFDSANGWLGHPGGWGNFILIDHGNGIQTLYAHLMREVQVQVGDLVVAGQHIGFQGNSGSSTGSHLHFEWRENGVRINPESRINFRLGSNW